MKKLFIPLVLILLACKEKDDLRNAVPMNYKFIEDYNNKIKIDSLSNRILMKGDTLAFIELRRIYILSEHSDEFLYFSTFMAEKYNYHLAYQTNYNILAPSRQSNILRKLAVYNLIKSSELGNTHDQELLNKMFPRGFPKSADFLEKVDLDSISKVKLY